MEVQHIDDILKKETSWDHQEMVLPFYIDSLVPDMVELQFQ